APLARTRAITLSRPGWQGSVPLGMQPISSPNNSVLVLGRILVYSDSDLPTAYGLAKQIRLIPLSRERSLAGTSKSSRNAPLTPRPRRLLAHLYDAAVTACSLPQDLVHRFSLGQFIDQLVQITDLLHELILDLLHAITADHAGNLGDVGVDAWCPCEESLKI